MGENQRKFEKSGMLGPKVWNSGKEAWQSLSKLEQSKVWKLEVCLAWLRTMIDLHVTVCSRPKPFCATLVERQKGPPYPACCWIWQWYPELEFDLCCPARSAAPLWSSLLWRKLAFVSDYLRWLAPEPASGGRCLGFSLIVKLQVDLGYLCFCWIWACAFGPSLLGFIPWRDRGHINNLTFDLGTILMAEDEKGTSSWYRVPVWDGNPLNFRNFKKEMNWWLASLDPDACRKFNVAAKWTLRQSGIVRARCEEFDPDELRGVEAITMKDPATGDEVTIQESDPFAGIRKLMSALEESMGKTEMDRKAELRKQFYQEIKRSPGERISAFCTRYRTLMAEMKREGISLPSAELGWFLKDRMGLDPLRNQLLETALQGREDYESIESEALRLFRDLHASDPLHKNKPPLLQRFLSNQSSGSSSFTRPSGFSSAASTFSGRSRFSSSASSAKGGGKYGGSSSTPHSRQALVAEVPEEEHEDEEELIPAQDDEAWEKGENPSLEEVLQTEAEILATELQELEEEGVSPDVLSNLEQGVEQAAESLITMREARSKIAEIKKDRGFGKAAGAPPNKKATGNQVPGKKAKTFCYDCGIQGHWAGDAGCPKPGEGLFRPKSGNKAQPKQVRVTEALNTEHGPLEAEEFGHEVLASSHLYGSISFEDAVARSNEVSNAVSLSVDKKMVGALDSACNRTCAGSYWMETYLAGLENAPSWIFSLVSVQPEEEVFKFGNGGVQVSRRRIRIPMMVGEDLVLAWVSVVPVPSLGLLLGRDFLDGIGCVLSFAKKKMRADHLSGRLVSLKQIVAGHFALRLVPPIWPRPSLTAWRRVGLDGVLELQVSPKDWLRRKLEALESLHDSHADVHEHLVTELSERVAALANSGIAVSSVAQAMSSQDNRLSSTTSPTSSLGKPKISCLRSSLSALPQPRSLPCDGQHREASKVSQPVAKMASQTAGKSRMASKRHFALVVAAAVAALSALSVPQCGFTSKVEAPSRVHGGERQFGQKACSKGLRGECLHGLSSSRVQLAPRSSWMASGVFGGPSAGRNVGSQNYKRAVVETSERSGQRGQREGKGNHPRREADRSCSSADWSERRSSIPERRPDKTGSIAECRVAGEGHHRADQRASASYLEDSHGQVRVHSSQGSASRTKEVDSGRNHGQYGKLFNVDAASAKVFKPSARSDSGGVALSSGSFRTKVWRDDPKCACSHRESLSSAKFCSSFQDGRRSRGSSSDPKSSTGFDSTPRSSAHSHRGRHGMGDRLAGTWLDNRRDHAHQPGGADGPLQCPLGSSERSKNGSRRSPMKDYDFNPWTINQVLKPGVAQMISDAWNKHCRDRALVSTSSKEVLAVMHNEWKEEMRQCMNETFVTHVQLALDGSQRPLVKEVFTATERVAKEATRRGHLAGESMSLENGWDFLRSEDRVEAIHRICQEKPKNLVLAFPCGPWSPLSRLGSSKTLNERRAEGKVLIEFALILAKMVRKWGGHFVIENPKGSEAWKLPEFQQFINEVDPLYVTDFDQCRFGLFGPSGLKHKKPTRVLTSSECVHQELHDMKCDGEHEHQPVIGGSSITRPAGHYPGPLARALVRGMEKQISKELTPREVLAVDEGDEDVDPVGVAVDPVDSESDVSKDGGEVDSDVPRISAAVKLAVKRLHENTGHRSNRRLARALVLSGAPTEVIRAAKNLKCSICDEKKRPKARRPASLPAPKDVSDQVHLDIFEVADVEERHFYVVHAIDWSSRFQMAEVLEHKSSEAVVDWFEKRWLPIFGPPRVLVADQGREFISWAFEEMCAKHSILLWHTAIQAPWANGICERGGGILKALTDACVRSHSLVGMEEVNKAVQESVQAYNSDINDMGVSPAQAAIGRQPRMVGDVLGNFSQRLAEHGLLEQRPGLARQVALRETAKIAMVRLHFSRSLRKAEFARSRNPTTVQSFSPGDIVYFWRESKYNSRTAPSKKRLSLRRWHGPALLVAMEGDNAGFVSFKGQLTKCAKEHLRLASSMEQISADVWHEAILEAVQSALWDASRPEGIQPPAPETIGTGSEQAAPSSSLPPVSADEMLAATQRGLESSSLAPTSSLPSASAVSSRRQSVTSGIPAPGTPIADVILRAGEQSRAAERAPSGRMQSLIEEASEFEAMQESSRKRSPEVPTEDLREEREQPSAMSPDPDPLGHDVLTLSVLNGSEHPIRLLQKLAAHDRKHPLEAEVHDHGTWKGDWPLPSRSDWQGHQLCKLPWPRGSHEALAVKTARREIKWREIKEEDKSAFHAAAQEGWNVWVTNDAVEVLSDEEALKVRSRLQQQNCSHKILTPRYVYTDKHDGVRTASNPLPVRANARLVVPGYQDSTAYGIRKDAPTASRTSQHLLFIITASLHWIIYSADVKSAFLKGEEFAPGERELYIGNIRAFHADEPMLPFGRKGLARLRKGIFGLADSPRRWYLRLHKSLVQLGWQRSKVDAAMWFLKDEAGKMHGVILSHVDDLLLSGDQIAKDSLDRLGRELGFGTLETGSFSYCGKDIRQMPDQSVEVSMESYHKNMSTVVIPLARRRTPASRLTPAEHKQLRGILGSLQWLVAQVRFDQGYSLSVLQGEPPTIATLMKANELVKKFKLNPQFSLKFKKIDLKSAGLMVVSDASLGNVNRDGGDSGEPLTKTYSQAAYYVLVADQKLMNGQSGTFAVLDARSHRIGRICRSTYGAELLGLEEATDAGLYCRGLFSEILGYDLTPEIIHNPQVELKLVVDAKDVYDKSTSDTPSYGSQKSLAFTVAWIRDELRRDGTDICWTSTSNMFVDCGTKDMDDAHVLRILSSCQWCTTFNQDYVKQSTKTAKSTVRVKRPLLPGQLLSPNDPLLNFLMKLAEQPGWHLKGERAIHVAKNAKSYRHPEPRFKADEFPLRTSYGRFDDDEQCEWRLLEKDVPLAKMPRQKLIGDTPNVLVTLYSKQIDPVPEPQRKESPVKAWSLLGMTQDHDWFACHRLFKA